MRKLDLWDAAAAFFTLVLGAGVWFIYTPAALILVGLVGLGVSWLGVSGKRR
ncbi:MAG: hypothetical protein V1912_00035 [bacterium]